MSSTDFISKEIVLKALNELPDQVSMEDLFDRIIYIYKIQTGLKQSQAREGKTLDELRLNVKTWARRK